MPTTKPATITDVSRRADVSVSTVSRVLAGQDNVGDDKAKRVRQAVKHLNYRPLRKGRKAKTGKDLIAIVQFGRDVLTNYSNDFAATLGGVCSALEERDMGVVLHTHSDDSPPSQELREGNFRGLLLAGNPPTDQWHEAFGPMPIVWLTSHRSDSAKGNSALAGNEHVGELAADYLLERGCRRLACLNVVSGNPASTVRSRFFEFTALQQSVPTEQIAVCEALPREGDPEAWATIETAVDRAVTKAFAADRAPDGLFLTDGLVAGLVHRSLRKRGVEPGRDVRLIVCGHNAPLLAALDPTPASIDLRGDVIGRCAVQQLLWRIERPEEKLPMDLLIRAQLIVP